jgi:hypothetical protein
MKGTFIIAFFEALKQKVGQEKFQEILKHAGYKEEPIIFAISDGDDEIFLKSYILPAKY